MSPRAGAAEARFHENPELVARIDANRADPSRLVKRSGDGKSDLRTEPTQE